MVNAFCERLKELRLDRKLSALKLAKAIGVSDTTILRWENGTMSPSVDALISLCEYFNVTPNYLMGYEY